MTRRKPVIPFDTVKIGYLDCKINLLSEKEAERLEINGEFSSKDGRIDIDESLTPIELVNTVWHEIMHGIAHVFGVEFCTKNENDVARTEEDVVTSITNGLITVKKDNPSLVEWTNEILYVEEG